MSTTTRAALTGPSFPFPNVLSKPTLDDIRGLAAAAAAPARAETQARAKRWIDLAGAAAGIVLLSPLMLLIAALIRLESDGPVIFRQKRVGLGGRAFWFLKFRTMVADAEHRVKDMEGLNESSCGVLFKIKNDPRVTRLGRFLRKTSLDELPQLWNVLKGEMSLVGPRPLQLRDSDLLRDKMPEAFASRLLVPAGLTGAWQVGGRSDTDALGMLWLDLYYVATWSIELDLWLITQTFLTVLKGRGAY